MTYYTNNAEDNIRADQTIAHAWKYGLDVPARQSAIIASLKSLQLTVRNSCKIYQQIK